MHSHAELDRLFAAWRRDIDSVPFPTPIDRLPAPVEQREIVTMPRGGNMPRQRRLLDEPDDRASPEPGSGPRSPLIT